MTRIQWRQEYSVGNAVIDNEHEHLIAQINNLYEELDKPMDLLAIETMLDNIQADISAHFALEELLMLEAGYAEYKSHKEDHDKLLDQINDMIFSFTENPETGRELLMEKLSDWFGHHFTSFDTRLHDQLG